MTLELGVHNILERALPSGIDAGEIMKFQLEDGTSWEQFLQRISSGVGAANSVMGANSFMFNYTTEPFMYYPDGDDVNRMPKITELSDMPISHGSDIGHMIDINDYGKGAGITYLGRRHIRTTRIEATVADVTNSALWGFEIDLLTRAFDNASKLIGTAGYNVPFLNGGTNNGYTPPAFNGKDFTSSHNHYLHNNSSYGTLLDNLAETLLEHGHMEPWVAMVSWSDIDDYRSLKGFINIISPQIQRVDYGGRTNEPAYINQGNMVFGQQGSFGYFQSKWGLIELRASQRIPTSYIFFFKSFGQNNPRNPLAVRYYASDGGFGVYIVPRRSSHFGYPIESLQMIFSYGIGVGRERTNGACGKMAGSYTVPTIS